MSSPFRGARLTASALALFTAAQTAAAEPEAKAATLPDIEVTTSQQKKATSRAAPRKRVAKPQTTAAKPQPAPAAATPTAQAPLTGSPAERSGSLSTPNTAEARAEIERTPGAVAVVPDTAYKSKTPATTIKDVFDYTPGVFAQPKWGEDTRLSIRGSGLSRNFHGRGIFLLADGVIPITTADGQSFFLEIDPSAYRYVEVYKGSNALRYGANSLGGAINFVSPTGYDSNLFGARADVGSFGFHKSMVNSGAVAGPVDYFITGTEQEQNGFRDHSGGESQRLSGNIGYRLNADVETRFYLNANRIRQDIPGTVRRSVALTSPTTPRLSNVLGDNELNFDSFRFANKTAMKLAPGTLAEFGGYFFQREMNHPIFRVFDNDYDDYGGFARVTHDRMIGGHKNRLIAGINLQNGDLNARQSANIGGERGALLSDTDQSSRTATVYAENSFWMTPSLAVVGGLQYADIERDYEVRFTAIPDADRQADFQLWSPKVGLLWDVTRDIQVFGNISASNEAPTFSEVRAPTAALPTLDPQEAVTYEIGTRGRTPTLTWDVALYRSNLENEFQCLDTGNIGSCDQINLDRTIHQGVEAGFGAQIVSGLLETASQRDALWLNAAYTFSDFRFDDDKTFGDNELPGAPRHYVRAELLYKHPSGIYFGPNVEWVPQAFFVDSANTLATSDYALLGAKVGFDNGGRVTAYIEARNLMDEAYIASASIANVATENSELFEPGSGRAVYGGISVKW